MPGWSTELEFFTDKDEKEAVMIKHQELFGSSFIKCGAHKVALV